MCLPGLIAPPKTQVLFHLLSGEAPTSFHLWLPHPSLPPWWGVGLFPGLHYAFLGGRYIDPAFSHDPTKRGRKKSWLFFPLLAPMKPCTIGHGTRVPWWPPKWWTLWKCGGNILTSEDRRSAPGNVLSSLSSPDGLFWGKVVSHGLSGRCAPPPSNWPHFLIKPWLDKRHAALHLLALSPLPFTLTISGLQLPIKL